MAEEWTLHTLEIKQTNKCEEHINFIPFYFLGQLMVLHNS